MTVDSTPSSATFRVLLIEDNPDDEFLARWVLKKVGIKQVTVARDGSEALAMLSGENRLPDLVILDLRLSKLDGIEILKKLRENSLTLELPVLILSSSEDPGDRASCRRLGIIDFVAKPLKAADLRKALDFISTR